MKHFVFVLVTVCLVACGNKASKEVKKTAAPSGTVALSVSATIGVVNSDSILEKYTFAIQARETMTKKAEDARLSLNTKAKQLQKELADFQNKINNNAFLSRERAEQEASRLQKKQALPGCSSTTQPASADWSANTMWSASMRCPASLSTRRMA